VSCFGVCVCVCVCASFLRCRLEKDAAVYESIVYWNLQLFASHVTFFSRRRSQLFVTNRYFLLQASKLPHPALGRARILTGEWE